VPLVLSIVGVDILSFSGYLGGTMVYNDGIAVGRHRRHTGTPKKTIRVSAGAPGEFVGGKCIELVSQNCIWTH
jgi:hypothetical protein